MARLRAKFTSIAAEANHFSFRYIDLQISPFNQIQFGILNFFFQIINSKLIRCDIVTN